MTVRLVVPVRVRMSVGPMRVFVGVLFTGRWDLAMGVIGLAMLVRMFVGMLMAMRDFALRVGMCMLCHKSLLWLIPVGNGPLVLSDNCIAGRGPAGKTKSRIRESGLQSRAC
jgi:hypothetical protein